MSGSRLYQNYERQLAAFKGCADRIHKRPEVEDIHQLRVAIKKMRTNLSLMQVASGGAFQKKRHFNLLSKLFDYAGVLREIQVNQALITTLGLEELCPDELCQSALHNYREALTSQSQNSVQRLKQALRAFNFRTLKKLNRALHEKITGLEDGVVVEQSNAFVAMKIEKIVALRPQIEEDRELHKIRMHLKAIAETYRLIIEMFADELMTKRVEHLKLLEGLIGEWHDLTVLIGSMNRFANSKEGIRFGPSLIMVEMDLSMRCQKIRSEVVMHLDDIF